MQNYLTWLSRETETKWWNDSAIPVEIDTAISMGALGVTTNPVLIFKSLQECPDYWRPIITDFDDDIEISDRAEELLRIVTTHVALKIHDIYLRTEGQHGYAFGQLNPILACDRQAMLKQGLRVASWAENIAVKIPTTRASIYVIEELSARGIALCTSLNFSVSQAIAAAEAYQRGVQRARENGISVKPCFVVQQGGRLEDYIRDVSFDLELGIPENIISKAGNILTKKTYSIFRKRGYEAIIAPAGLRGIHHLSELAGGKFVFSLQPRIQRMVLEAKLPLIERIDEPVNEETISELCKIREFRKAYYEEELPDTEFMAFGVMQKTLSQFMETGWAMLETFGSNTTTQRWS
ncbi:MAG: transaldolase family protein [Eubacteriales bacterium]|nr:transaldolase family protein [Eubacteriales bacterium]